MTGKNQDSLLRKTRESERIRGRLKEREREKSEKGRISGIQ